MISTVAAGLALAGCSSSDDGGGSGSGSATAKAKARVSKAKGQAAETKQVKVQTVVSPGRDRDCSDFQTQRQAQRHLLPGDPNGLDADGDGRACASLPCPCAEVKVKQDPNVKAIKKTGYSFTGPVTSVADGDTIHVAKPGGVDEDIRMIGIDTPEVYGGVECGGPRASAEMKRLAVGRVTVTTDPTQDRRDQYGRLLAYINKGGHDLGQIMIARGLASVYVYSDYFQRFNAYNRAQNRAIAADRGSLKKCDISPG